MIVPTLRRWAARPFANRLRVWSDGGLEVYFRKNLDGAGRLFSPTFLNFVKSRHREPIPKVFEWCSGPGFIGFSLLAAGACRKLCLADVNPRAVECIARTVRANRLQDRVTYYVSDSFDSIPANEVFDVVVANPPFYSSLNPGHPLYKLLEHDLRPYDRDWRAHEKFYSSVAAHLNPGAMLYIMEVAPDQAVYRTPGYSEPLDIRPRPPIDDFRRMIHGGGLAYVDTVPFMSLGEYTGDLVVSTLPSQRE